MYVHAYDPSVSLLSGQRLILVTRLASVALCSSTWRDRHDSPTLLQGREENEINQNDKSEKKKIRIEYSEIKQ